MANVFVSTPITKPRGLANGVEAEFHGELPILKAKAMPESFLDESSIQLMNLDLTPKEDVVDCDSTTSTNIQKIPEELNAGPSQVPKAFLKSKVNPPKKANSQGATTKGNQPSTSQSICQNKYSCENCQQSFKNRILLQRHVCPNTAKSQRGLNFTLNNAAHKIQEKHVECANKTTLNVTKRTPNATFHDRLPFYKTRQSMYTPRKSFLPVTTTTNKKSPSLQVAKKFTCKNCNMKFTSSLLLNLHTKKMCVAPLRKVPITDSPTPGLHKLVINNPVKVQDLINTTIKNNGFSVDADVTKPKAKTPVVRRYKDLGGIPVSSKLSLAFQNLQLKLQSGMAAVNTDVGKNTVQ